jgi:ribosome-associated protein
MVRIGSRWSLESLQRKEGPLNTPLVSRASLHGAPASVSQPSSGIRTADAQETLQLVLAQLDDMKAEDTITIDLHGKSSIGDYMVISSGRSNRHVGSIADRVIEDLARAGIKTRVEGMPHADWVLIDAGDVIVNVFRPEVRTFYNLEKMWTSTGSQRRAS